MGFEIENSVLKKYIEEPKVTEVVIPDNVTRIGESAFEGCTSLESITIPDSVTVIEEYAFSVCTSLKSIEIPGKVLEIGNYTFTGCKSLESVIISEGVKGIGNFTFNGCCSVTNIEIPNSVEQIGHSAFRECSSLKFVKIPENAVLGKAIFWDCTSLESVIIPSSVKEILIGSVMFFGCTNLKELTAFGYKISTSCCEWNNIKIEKIQSMLKKRDYSEKVDYRLKSQFVAKIFLENFQPEAEEYIKNNTVEVVNVFTELNDYETVKNLLESGKFVTEKNIDQLIDYAISNTRNGGDMQIQILLTNYKHEHFVNSGLDFL